VFDEHAVQKIFDAKQRPADNPLIAHIARVDQIKELATEVTETAKKLIDAFFPGPLTVVLKKRDRVPMIATAGLDTVGIRMPGSDLAHRFLRACGTPVVAPSANLSGRPSPTTWESVQEDLDGRIDCILMGEATQIGIESSVVDCTADVPRVLRIGSVSIDELRSVIPETRDIVLTHDVEAPMSPGMKHTHYSPRAEVILMGGSGSGTRDLRKAAYIGFNRPAGRFALVRQVADVEAYAHTLYEFFRECDRRGIKTIFCDNVAETGIGSALLDRIRRAAAK
jgi:L-threonylcarbamoyladenylate synthase